MKARRTTSGGDETKLSFNGDDDGKRNGSNYNC